MPESNTPLAQRQFLKNALLRKTAVLAKACNLRTHEAEGEASAGIHGWLWLCYMIYNTFLKRMRKKDDLYVGEDPCNFLCYTPFF